MLKKIVLFSSVLLCYCSTTQRPISEWQALDAASDVRCQKWPMPEKAIAVREVEVMTGETPVVMTDYMLRNSAQSRARFIQKLEKKLDLEAMEQRRYGAESLTAGGGEIQRRTHIAVIQKLKGSTVLELRSIDDNIVRFSTKLPFNDVVQAEVVTAGKKWWLKVARGDGPVDDAKTQIMLVEWAKGQITLRAFDRDWAGPVHVISHGDMNLAVWGERTGEEATSFRFFVASLNTASGHVEAKRELEITTDINVESWAALTVSRGFYLAAVDGDSLVGQSKLKIARIDWEGDYHRVSWVKTRSLDHEHVSEPMWIHRQQGPTLLLPKWVDNESTIAAYTVDESDIANAQAIGVFQNGIRVMNSFMHKGEPVAVVRYRKGQQTQFELCHLGDF